MNAICRICAVALFVAGSTPAFAATISISQNPAWTYTTAGVSPTITNGNQMDGMRVTAVVSNGTSMLTLTQAWTDSAAPDTGGVSFVTPEFSLSVTGDTFEANYWLLDFSNATGWRLLDTSQIEECLVLEKNFPGSRGLLHQSHLVWDVVYARVS